MPQVVDYSFARPDPEWIARSGYVGVMRYLSGGRSSKDITYAELQALHAAGLAVGFVWETTSSRAGEGYAAGAQDAQRANAQADALGVPSDVPIYFAVDFDASPPQVAGYFQGVHDNATRPWRPYGEYSIAEAYADTWQCAAWSGNGEGSGGSIQGRRLSKNAVLFQRVGYVLNNTCDANDVLGEWGGWLPGHEVEAPQEEDDMASLLVLNPDVTDHEEWWEVFGSSPYRRLVNTPWGYTGERDALAFMGAKVFGADVDPDARRFWMYARIPVVAGTVDPKAIADQVIAGLGLPGVDTHAVAEAVIDELRSRL